uniref:CobW C-terminal domain-containing protein n=1 Tax=Hanusia phi TaxID=3032 RepID=A0A7S0ETI6_9CRYP|mmetsp:Transcript_31556/g.70993  ORF Transcript_31556/g.70993 Transcript_31556/m.70993 type:complete len:276 (+) Transcript_31556:1-828(+)
MNHLLNILQDDEYDYVLIETSGLADPAPIMQTLFSHSNASGRFFLDGVVAIIDCHNVWRHLEGRGWGAKTPEVYRQIAHATTMLLNKTDRRRDTQGGETQGSLEELEELLGDLNPHARVLRCQHCDVALDDILDQRAFDASRVAEVMVTERRLAGDEHASTEMARHAPGIRAISVASDPGDLLDLPRFLSWASALVEERWRDVYRMKGVLAVQGSQRLFVLQGVCGELKGEEGREWRDEEERRSELIVIGKNLSHESIERGFRQCLLSSREQSEI